MMCVEVLFNDDYCELFQTDYIHFSHEKFTLFLNGEFLAEFFLIDIFSLVITENLE